MIKWEYLRITVIYDTNDIINSVNANDRELLHKVEHHEWDAYLNKLGDEGWELVSVNMWNDGYDEAYYFKRRSPHPNPPPHPAA
jgi:hypothetical protein